MKHILKNIEKNFTNISYNTVIKACKKARDLARLEHCMSVMSKAWDVDVHAVESCPAKKRKFALL